MGSLNCNVNVVLHVHDNIDNHCILVLYTVKHYGLFYQCVLSDYVATKGNILVLKVFFSINWCDGYSNEISICRYS